MIFFPKSIPKWYPKNYSWNSETFDLAGNVAEWNETSQTGGTAGYTVRGGSWFFGPEDSRSQHEFPVVDSIPRDLRFPDIGFRVARPVAIPEPSVGVLLAISAIALSSRRGARRKAFRC